MTISVERLPDATEIAALVQQVVWAFLGEDAQLTDRSSVDSNHTWTGCVMVEGSFRGAVTVSGSRELALRLGSKMFAAEAADLSDDEARDAFAEFTNVIGGNLKSLISTMAGETCKLCLPIVADGTIRIPGPTRRQEAAFVFGDERFAVDIFELAQADSSVA
ncbi:MAG TPA: chemotaxis protein CheX [Polyangiaceae bacterium]|nr:chemotaxis protein CheX [Polyangiaceae bacterium]